MNTEVFPANQGPDPERGYSRMQRARLFWFPLALIALDGLLLLVSLLLAIVIVPILLLLFLLFIFLRWLLAVITRGRIGGRRKKQIPDAERTARATTLNDAQRRELARRFRPCHVLFPENRELGPPYRTDEDANVVGADYHPRSVDVLLRHVRFRGGRGQWLPDMPGNSSVDDIRADLGSAQEYESSMEIPWLHGGSPLKIMRHLFPFGRQFRAHWAIPVPKAECGCSIVVWDRYMEIIERDEMRPPGEQRYGRAIYARVLEGRELPDIPTSHPLAGAIAIQYWWFFFYNDAWNRHQGDWEGITVYLLPTGNGEYKPLGAAYGNHDLGRWRRWEDLQRVDDQMRRTGQGEHAVVYVARGSHASYFEYNPSGYHPAMTRNLRIPFLGDYSIPSQFVLETRSAIDWVADAHSGTGNGVSMLIDDVRVMPNEAILRDPERLRQDDEWWWLAYRGLWGSPEVLPFFGGSGPRGPREQGVRWSNPFRWVMRECIADDLPYWVQMFASWQAGELAASTAAAPAIPRAETVDSGPTGES
ncbi:MAG: hypothetical protein KC479_13010 [Dehalococcoidia bacterium]|nr:hypothetical protein [Dehalococcoidia bacterium]